MSTAKPTQGTSTDTQVVMPLLDHLKELRNRLFKIAIALLIATVVSLIFAKQAVVILIKPMGDNLPQALEADRDAEQLYEGGPHLRGDTCYAGHRLSDRPFRHPWSELARRNATCGCWCPAPRYASLPG